MIKAKKTIVYPAISLTNNTNLVKSLEYWNGVSQDVSSNKVLKTRVGQELSGLVQVLKVFVRS